MDNVDNSVENMWLKSFFCTYYFKNYKNTENLIGDMKEQKYFEECDPVEPVLDVEQEQMQGEDTSMLTERMEQRIIQAYEANMAHYPDKRREVEAFLDGKHSMEQACLRHLYAFMAVDDVVSYSVQEIFGYVEASLAVREELTYAKQVPEELFFAYVLPCRINNEHLDGSRAQLFSMLRDRVQGKTMYEAALEVNYWCYEHVTYTPADDRTLSPLAVMKRGKGRCGEESTFTAAALRSVGIPARQCYAPRWAHCDDNHAWVEIWADGAWHYLGACEPEPELDKGWFTAAASKAMLIRSRAWAGVEEKAVEWYEKWGGQAIAAAPIYTLVNSTAVYGETEMLRVRVLDGGRPCGGVTVRFQIINYSELYALYEAETDAKGWVSIRMGKGDVRIFAQKEGRMIGRQIDLRREREAVLELRDGAYVWEMDGRQEEFDMVPPAEMAVQKQVRSNPEAASRHRARLAACDAVREQASQGAEELSGEEEEAIRGYLAAAGQNWREAEAFFQWDGAEREEKLLLGSTLREKDWADCRAKTLEEYLLCARPYRHDYPKDWYVSYVLAPRIANEMILPERAHIRRLLVSMLREACGQADGNQIYRLLKDRIRILPDYGADIETASPLGALRYGMCSKASFPVVFVAACRSLGIAARLNPVTNEPEWASPGENPQWRRVKEMDFHTKDFPSAGTAELTLRVPGEQGLEYGSQISLGVWDGEDYRTLSYGDRKVEDGQRFTLDRGYYRILLSLRQIDGSVSVRAMYLTLNGDREVTLRQREDQTGKKLRHVSLGDIIVKKDGREGTLRKLWPHAPGILILAEPGKEPTEHLLQELLACREEYREREIPIAILLKDQRQSRHETLQRVLQKLPQASVMEWQEDRQIHKLHADMGVGDERLPFAVAVDRDGRGLYACANYNIRTAQTLLHVLEEAAMETVESRFRTENAGPLE